MGALVTVAMFVLLGLAAVRILAALGLVEADKPPAQNQGRRATDRPGGGGVAKADPRRYGDARDLLFERDPERPSTYGDVRDLFLRRK